MNAIWMTTQSGRKIDLNDVRAQDIALNDIAHALSRICRFNGHTSRFYSVACHSSGMARYAQEKKLPTDVVLKCLLHDAQEAYYGDITTPVAQYLHIDWSIWNMGRSVEKAIAEAFFGDKDVVCNTPLVKRIDQLFCMVEGYVLVGGPLWDEAKVVATLTEEMKEDWDLVSRIVRSYDYGSEFGRVKCDYYDLVRHWQSERLRELYLDEYAQTHPATEVGDAEDTAESSSPAQG